MVGDIQMGNSALGGSLCNGTIFPCRLKLGSYLAIEVIKIKQNKLEEEDEDEDEDKNEDEDEDEIDDKKIEDEDEDKYERPNNLTKVTYTIDDWSKCELGFRINNNCNITSFTINDQNNILGIFKKFTIRKVEPNHLETSYLEPNNNHFGREYGYFKLKSTSSGSGNECYTKSDFFFYHTDRTNRGLFVLEQKKKSQDEKPFMITVAHYYAIHDFYLRRFKIDNIGLSVIVKVESLNNKGLHCTLEGPTQHPPAALIYMMEVVNSTRIWNPTSCPHCANLQEQQSSRAKGSFSRRGINNDGNFSGNGCGNMVEGDFNQYTIYRKH